MHVEGCYEKMHKLGRGQGMRNKENNKGRQRLWGVELVFSMGYFSGGFLCLWLWAGDIRVSLSCMGVYTLYGVYRFGKRMFGFLPTVLPAAVAMTASIMPYGVYHKMILVEVVDIVTLLLSIFFLGFSLFYWCIRPPK